MTLYVITRQTTQSGTATDTIKVVGRDLEEALLKAKIKGYRAMENFMNEASMISAHFEISDLNGHFYVTENWEKEVVEE